MSEEADTSDASTPVGAVTEDGDIVTSGADSGQPAMSARLRKLWAVLVSAGLGGGAALISAILVISIVVLLQVAESQLLESTLFLVSLEFITGQLLLMGGISVLYLWATGKGLSYVSIRRPTLIESVVILIIPFVVIVATMIVNLIGMAIGIEGSAHALAELEDIDPRFYLYLIPFMLLIVGPFEELLYRGVIQTRLREEFGVVSAITIASLIFVLIHLPAYGLGQAGVAAIALSLTALFVGSIIFGAVYEWTGNLTVVAVIHGLYNSILLGVLYLVTIYEDELMELSEAATVVGGL